MDIITSSSAERTQEPEYPRILPVEELYKPLLSQAKAWAQASGVPIVPTAVVQRYLSGASSAAAAGSMVDFAVQKDADTTDGTGAAVPILHSLLREKLPSASAAIVTVAVQRMLSKRQLLPSARDQDSACNADICLDFARYLLQCSGNVDERLRDARSHVRKAFLAFLMREDLDSPESPENSTAAESGLRLASYVPALDALTREYSSDIYSRARAIVLSHVSGVRTQASWLLAYESCDIADSNIELVIPHEGAKETSGSEIRSVLRPYFLLQWVKSFWHGPFEAKENSVLQDQLHDPEPRRAFLETIAHSFAMRTSWHTGSALLRFGKALFQPKKGMGACTPLAQTIQSAASVSSSETND